LGRGVYGLGTGIGVYGQSTGSGISLAGVWGTSADAIGTFGHSDNTNGMWAESSTWDALVAVGGRYGGFLQGATYGVVGGSTGSTPHLSGVFGKDSSGATGFSGFGTSGVRGESKTSIGVLGIGGDKAILGINTGGSLNFGFLGSAGYGVYSGGDFGGSGAKYFVEPHPTDASKVIRYVCLEGPESGTYFRGSAQVIDGSAVITVPEDFRIVTDTEGLTVQLTPVRAPASMYIISEDLNQIVVKSNRDVRFHYMVNGVRKAFKDHQAIENGNEF